MRNWTVQSIAELLKNGQYSPTDLAEVRVWLGGHYAYRSAELSEVLMRKPAKWNELRREQKSDTATERVFQATPDGLKETELRLELKAVERLMSATKTRLDIAQGESLSQY